MESAHRQEAAGSRRECRERINDLLDQPESSFAAQVMHYSMIFLIMASTAVAIVETMPEFQMNPIFFPAEMCITVLFTIEFVLRLYACDSLRAFISNCFNIIDFLAIFPGYIGLLVLLVRANEQSGRHTDVEHVHRAASSMRTLRMVRVVRLLRVFRVMRLAKVARYSQLLSIIFAVCVKVSQSGLVVVLMLIGSAMILSASIVYIVESEICEDTGAPCSETSGFVSIPASFWWAIATLTTVGYGDMVPQTSGGKVVGGVTAIMGIIVVSIGIALVSINFHECFIEEKVRAEAKKRSGPAWPESRPKNEQEINEALISFDRSSALLLKKLRGITLRQEEGMQLTTMLDVLSSHTTNLSADVRVLVDRLLEIYDGCTEGADTGRDLPPSLSE